MFRTGNFETLVINKEISNLLNVGRSNTLPQTLKQSVVFGRNNTVSNNYSSLLGGINNEITGEKSSILGGSQNKVSGNNSVAAGYRANVTHNNVFMFSDSTDADFNSEADNMAMFRVSNGFKIVTRQNNQDNNALVINNDGSLTVHGNLNVLGNTTTIDSVISQVKDPIIFLAKGNTTDNLDIGFFGTYNNGTNQLYSGLFRDASDNGIYKLVGSSTENPNDNNTISSFSYGNLEVSTIGVSDTNESNHLRIKWDEDDTADRELKFKVNNGNRTLSMNEDLTIGDGHSGTITFSEPNKVLTIIESCTIGGGGTLNLTSAFDVTGEGAQITTEDNKGFIVLDNSNIEFENLDATQRNIKITSSKAGDTTLTFQENLTIGDGQDITIQGLGDSARSLIMNESLTIGDGNDGTIVFSQPGKTLTIAESTTIGGGGDLNLNAALTISGEGVTITTEDNSGSITLDNTNIEFENLDTTQRNLKFTSSKAGDTTISFQENLTIADGQDITIQGLGNSARSIILNESLTIGDGNDGTIVFSEPGKTLTIAESTTIGGGGDLNLNAALTISGEGVTITTEDNSGSITLDNTNIEFENLDNTQRNLKFTSSKAGDTTISLQENLTIGDGQDITIQGLGDSTRSLILNESLTIGNGNDGTITFTENNKTLTIQENVSVNQDLTTTSDVTFNTINATGNMTINGNLNVLGQLTTINTTNTEISDPLIVLSSSQNGNPVVDTGILFKRGNETNKSFIWDESADIFSFISTTDNGTTAGDITISNYENIKAKDAILEGDLYVKDKKIEKRDDEELYFNNDNLQNQIHQDTQQQHWNLDGNNTSLITNYNIGINTNNPNCVLDIQSTDSIQLPVGNIEQRYLDNTKTNFQGQIRFNNQTQTFEGFDGYNWITIGKHKSNFLYNYGKHIYVDNYVLSNVSNGNFIELFLDGYQENTRINLDRYRSYYIDILSIGYNNTNDICGAYIDGFIKKGNMVTGYVPVLSTIKRILTNDTDVKVNLAANIISNVYSTTNADNSYSLVPSYNHFIRFTANAPANKEMSWVVHTDMLSLKYSDLDNQIYKYDYQYPDNNIIFSDSILKNKGNNTITLYLDGNQTLLSLSDYPVHIFDIAVIGRSSIADGNYSACFIFKCIYYKNNTTESGVFKEGAYKDINSWDASITFQNNNLVISTTANVNVKWIAKIKQIKTNLSVNNSIYEQISNIDYDNKLYKIILKNSGTGQVQLFKDASSSKWTINTNTGRSGYGYIMAYTTTSKASFFTFQFSISETQTLRTTTTITANASSALWNISLSKNNNELQLYGTGDSNDTTYWIAYLRYIDTHIDYE